MTSEGIPSLTDLQSANSDFEVLSGFGYFILKLKGKPTSETALEFQSTLDQTAIWSQVSWVVDAEALTTFTKPWIRLLLNLAVVLKQNSKGLRFVNVSEEVANTIGSEGLGRTFLVSESMEKAQAELRPPRSGVVDSEFVAPFLTATRDLLRMQAETECKAGKPWVRKEQRQALGDVCGVIPLNCPGLSGAIVIAFYEQTLDQILIRMLGENWKVTTSLEDAAGEFMNVIYGAAKAALNSRGYSFENVLPIIVKNARNNLALQFEGASVVIPFESTAGAFWIEIYIRSEQSGNQFHFDS